MKLSDSGPLYLLGTAMLRKKLQQTLVWNAFSL